jgi:ABC-2 type transport system permease protein
MSMLTIARYELIRILRHKATYFILLVLPLLLIFILGSALSNVFQVKDEALKQARLVWVQEESGPIAEGLAFYFEEPEISKLVAAERVDSREAALNRLADGTADVALIVPVGFHTSVMTGQEADWRYIPGKDSQANLIGKAVVQAFTSQINSQQAFAIALGPESLLNAQASMPSISSSSDSLVTMGKLHQAGKDYSAIQYYSAKMLIMFLLYAGMNAAISLVQEKEDRTLQRLNSTPTRPISILLGKILGHSVISIFQAIIIVSFTWLVYDVHWGESLIKLAVLCLLTILASMCLAMLVAFLLSSFKAVMAVFQTLIICMTFVSGGFSPDVGPFIQQLSQYTISQWASDGILKLMLGASSVSQNATILLFFCIGLLLVTAGMYRKVGYR